MSSRLGFVCTSSSGRAPIRMRLGTDWSVSIPQWEVRAQGVGLTHERISGRDVAPVDGRYVLSPYSAWWLTEPGG